MVSEKKIVEFGIQYKLEGGMEKIPNQNTESEGL